MKAKRATHAPMMKNCGQLLQGECVGRGAGRQCATEDDESQTPHGTGGRTPRQTHSTGEERQGQNSSPSTAPVLGPFQRDPSKQKQVQGDIQLSSPLKPEEKAA